MVVERFSCRVKPSDLAVSQPDPENPDTYQVTFENPATACSYKFCPLARVSYQPQWNGTAQDATEALDKGVRQMQASCAYQQHDSEGTTLIYPVL